MTVTDVYCFFNRARGSELVSPDDLLAACKQMESLQLPMKLRQFDSGVLVVQLASQNDADNSKIIVKLIHHHGPLDEMKLSHLIKISIPLARQQLEQAEAMEYLCRDESLEGVRFYHNFFKYGIPKSNAVPEQKHDDDDAVAHKQPKYQPEKPKVESPAHKPQPQPQQQQQQYQEAQQPADASQKQKRRMMEL